MSPAFDNVLPKFNPTKFATLDKPEELLSWFWGIKTVYELNFAGNRSAYATPTNTNMLEI